MLLRTKPKRPFLNKGNFLISGWQFSFPPARLYLSRSYFHLKCIKLTKGLPYSNRNRRYFPFLYIKSSAFLGGCRHLTTTSDFKRPHGDPYFTFAVSWEKNGQAGCRVRPSLRQYYIIFLGYNPNLDLKPDPFVRDNYQGYRISKRNFSSKTVQSIIMYFLRWWWGWWHLRKYTMKVVTQSSQVSAIWLSGHWEKICFSCFIILFDDKACWRILARMVVYTMKLSEIKKSFPFRSDPQIPFEHIFMCSRRLHLRVVILQQVDFKRRDDGDNNDYLSHSMNTVVDSNIRISVIEMNFPIVGVFNVKSE